MGVIQRLARGEDQQIDIMKLLLLSLLGLVAVEATHEEMKKIMNEINLYNLRSQCWGEENVQAYDIAIYKAMELLTPDLTINIDGYTKPVAEIEGFNPEVSVAGQDPEFEAKLHEGYMDCYRISQNWPQAALNKNPLSKIFGRHMLFFKRAHKTESKMCAKAQMLKWLETIYGSDPNEDPSEYGLPKDKYDAAAVSIMVLNNAASPEEEFVGDFFWGMAH